MIYSFEIETPANTAQTSPQKTVKELEHGILVLKYIVLPPGCAGLVGISISDARYQIWPKNPDGWFVGEGKMDLNDKYKFYDPPYTLDIYTYNEDDTYVHKPIVILQLLRPDQFEEVSEYVYLDESILEAEAQ